MRELLNVSVSEYGGYTVGGARCVHHGGEKLDVREKASIKYHE